MLRQKWLIMFVAPIVFGPLSACGEQNVEDRPAVQKEAANSASVSSAKADDLAANAHTDAAKRAGRIQFLQCAACHSVEADGPPKVGPNLNCIVDAPAGSKEGFNYSQAFRKAREEGLVWDTETLSRFLEDSEELVPNNAMTFGGVADPNKRDQLIDHLRANCDSN